MIKPILYNKDLRVLEKKDTLTTDEMILLRLGRGCLEKEIQKTCNTIFCAKFDPKGFVAIDNGDTAGGKLLPYQRILLYANKKKLGTKTGFSDVMLIRENKICFVEFKRIGSESQIDIKEEQVDYRNWLESMGFKSYITNNPIFFNKVILSEFSK